jgi:hypothetical protein
MQKEKKKVKDAACLPVCAHSPWAWHGLKVGPLPPAVATALLGEAHPLFPQIPKSENRPAVPAYLPYLTCACAYARACCDRDTDRACSHFKSTFLLLHLFIYSLCLVLFDLQTLPSWPFSVSLFYSYSNTEYSVLSRDYQFTPTRQHSRDNLFIAARSRSRTHSHGHAHATSQTSQDACHQSPPSGSCPRRACPLYQVHWKALHPRYVMSPPKPQHAHATGPLGLRP